MNRGENKHSTVAAAVSTVYHHHHVLYKLCSYTIDQSAINCTVFFLRK